MVKKLIKYTTINKYQPAIAQVSTRNICLSFYVSTSFGNSGLYEQGITLTLLITLLDL
jgi:hypothetical protein